MSYQAFIDGGAEGKEGYRYQDWCAMFVLLSHYEESKKFEHINLEMGKLDFEVFFKDEYHAYQIKLNNKVTSTELNKIFLTYLSAVDEKRRQSNIKENSLNFIFSLELKNSLLCLMQFLSKNKGIKEYHKKTKLFIENSLKGIVKSQLRLFYKSYTYSHIQAQVNGLAKKILERFYPKDRYLPTGLIDSFVTGFKGEIENRSCHKKISERNLRKDEFEALIKKVVSLGRIDLDRGQKSISPKVEKVRLEPLIPEFPKIYLGDSEDA